jgi:hypothetical protein
MITIFTPTRSNGRHAPSSFADPYGAQKWIDRQITGGDDGDWAVSTTYVYDNLDEHDKDKGIGQYGPRLTIEEVRNGRFS